MNPVSPTRLRHLEQMAEYGNRHYDPAERMLLLPMPDIPNVHCEHLDASPRHPVREALAYALCLLETGGPEALPRAEEILERVIALQDASDPEAKTFGLWPYYMEDPVPVWPWPDFNWADFNGMTLLLVWHRHGERLSPGTAGCVREAIRRAAICIRRRNVTLTYTNIALKGTFVTLSASEMLKDADLKAYAMDRLRRLAALIAATGSFAEYNSPTYAAFSLGALHAIDTYVRDPEARRLAAPLLERFWREVASRFHARTRELAAPHARAYTPSLAETPDMLGALIEQASGGVIDFTGGRPREPFGALYACVVEVRVSDEIVARLAAGSDEPHEVKVTSVTGPADAPRVQTTWLDRVFCLGSVSFQNGWEQRQNFMAHWPSAKGGNGFLRHLYLRDDRPCCSGHFVSRQQGGAVVAGSFLAAYADHHVSVPVEGTTASFLGVVVELDARGEAPRVWCGGAAVAPGERREVGPDEIVRVELEEVAVEWRWVEHDVVPGPPPKPRVERGGVGGDRVRLILPHYEGERRWLRWLDFKRAASTYALRMAASGGALPPWPGFALALPESTPVSQAAAESWGLEQAQEESVSA